MEESIIRVENISKAFKVYESTGEGLLSTFMRKYSINQALDSVSFEVKKGEILALLGRNGSGKSTMVKILMGIVHQDSGTASVLGLDPYEDRIKMSMQMGVVLGAHTQLYWNIPPIDTFNLNRVVYKIPQDAFEQRLAELIEMLEVKDIYKKQTRVLSLGERMKCNFIAAVLHDPKVVVLDEPTIGVDLPSRNAIANTILEMRRKRKASFVLTTHVVDDILIADRIVLLDKGKKLYDGDSAGIRKLTSSRIQAELSFKTKVPGNIASIGKVLNRKGRSVRLEMDPADLKSKAFIKLLQSRELNDYRVSEPGLSYLLNMFYASLGKKR